MKDKVDLINEVFGFQFLTYYFIVVTHLCQIPDKYLFSPLPLSWFPVICQLLFNSVVWIVAAEFQNYTINSFVKWCKLCKSHPENNQLETKLILVKLELHSEPIALSCKFFNISNKFLASVSCLSFIGCK